MGKIKSKRKKLNNLILLLIVSIIMLGTSTYAWFTANQVVTINKIDVKVETSNGLQISTNAAEWKSIITTADITAGYTGHTNQLPSTVTNVSTDGTVNQSKGTLNMYRATIGNDETTGDYNITTTLETDKAGSTGNYVAFDVFLRVDKAQNIYLTTDSGVDVKENTEDRGLKNASRIAFVTLGNGDSTDPTSSLIKLNNGVASKAIIWEPNYDAHTDMVTSSVAVEYGVTLKSDTSTPYYGITKEINTAVDLKELVNGTDTTNAKLVTPNIITPTTMTNYEKVFELPAGVTKMRIYMWIEGQDIDCENNATGSDITYNLQFSTQSSSGA